MPLTKLDPEHKQRVLDLLDAMLHPVAASVESSSLPFVAYDNVGVGLRGSKPCKPTHVVVDCDGDILGRGLSESEALLDALLRSYVNLRHRHAEHVEREHDLRHALKGLGL